MIKFKEKLEQILRKKCDDYFVLQSDKIDLTQNMANPDAINNKSFAIEEQMRQINQLTNLKNTISNTDNVNYEDYFNNLLKEKSDEIERKKEQGENVEKDTKDFVSLKIVGRETIRSLKEDKIMEGNQDVNLGDYDSSGSDE